MTKAVKMNPYDKSKRDAISGTDTSAKIANMGIDCGNIKESLPKFAKADCETVISGKNNTFIVFGRDRPGSKHTGYGGKGHTGCGMIDIVVGRMSCKEGPMETYNYTPDAPPERILVDPMCTPYQGLKHGQSETDIPVAWASDAARIYISQKTDIDKNFNIPPGKVGDSVGRSGIAIKADAVRIIGNEGIKLVTKSDGTNSFGTVLTNNGIDLIANNQGRRDNARYEMMGSESILAEGPSLQPLVKGDNLRSCLSEILSEMIKMQSTLQGFLFQMISANIYWGLHTHPPAIPFMDVFISLPILQGAMDVNNTLVSKTLMSFTSHSNNLESIKGKYLTQTGTCFINSTYNNTN